MHTSQLPRLTRAEASSYLLNQHGISRTPATLAKLACRGGGPAFRKAGTKVVVYDRAELDRWALSILSEPLTSTSAVVLAAANPTKAMEGMNAEEQNLDLLGGSDICDFNECRSLASAEKPIEPEIL